MNDMIPFEVEMRAFGQPGEIRVVDVPKSKLPENPSLYDYLRLIFEFGQNDFQPKNQCSVSVGDVIRFYTGARYYVEGIGFSEVEPFTGIRRRLKEDGTLGEALGKL